MATVERRTSALPRDPVARARDGARPTERPISVLVVKDDAIVRSWIRLSLDTGEFRLTGEAESTAEAIELVERSRPDVLLVDDRLAERKGTDVVRELRKSGIDTPAVVITANSEHGFNDVAREAGAQGTLLKTGRGDELRSALRRAADGRRAFDPRHPGRPDGVPSLSPRERDVMRMVAEGATNREIAEQLGIGAETVKTLISRAFTKLGARKRAEAVSTAHRRGLL